MFLAGLVVVLEVLGRLTRRVSFPLYMLYSSILTQSWLLAVLTS